MGFHIFEEFELLSYIFCSKYIGSFLWWICCIHWWICCVFFSDSVLWKCRSFVFDLLDFNVGTFAIIFLLVIFGQDLRELSDCNDNRSWCLMRYCVSSFCVRLILGCSGKITLKWLYPRDRVRGFQS